MPHVAKCHIAKSLEPVYRTMEAWCRTPSFAWCETRATIASRSPNMSQPGFRERLRYRTDNFLAGGSGPLFLSLVIAFTGSLTAIVVVRLLIGAVLHDNDTSSRKHAWSTFLQLTDPGNMSQDNDTNPFYKVATVAAGFTGVVIFSSLIAFLTTALSDALAELRKGKSRVLEEDFTLILGWGGRVVEILTELSIANESSKDAPVVVLANVPKEEIDEHLRVHFTERKTTRVITRSGSTASLASLAHVRIERAKSAIVLATCDASAPADAKLASDAHVVKTVLAVATAAGSTSTMTVVAEVFDPKNRELVHGILPGRVVVVDVEEILAKIMVQTSRTSGLAVVYSELLSFDGCEIYFHEAKCEGVTFGDLQFRFADGVPIGLQRGDGALLVRPPPDTVLRSDDEVILVATDDSAIKVSPMPVASPAVHLPPARRIERRTERMLILGFSPKAPTLIREYADYVLEGSAVDVLVRSPSDSLCDDIAALATELEGLSLTVLDRNPLDYDVLAAQKPFDYDTVMLLRQDPSAERSAERIDAESLMVLLHLRRLARGLPTGTRIKTKTITEVLDNENRDLIHRAGVDDFIISDRLVSMVFAQLSEQPRMKRVYDDLFSEAGSEIYVKPAWLYFETLPIDVTYADLMKVAQLRNGEVCLGYKLHALERDEKKNFGVSLVPSKDTKVRLTPEDALVVVAEDDR